MDTKASAIEQAKAAVEADGAERAKMFAVYIEAGSREYNCDLVAAPQIVSDGRIVAVVQIVAR
jgi:hypothetical protein